MPGYIFGGRSFQFDCKSVFRWLDVLDFLFVRHIELMVYQNKMQSQMMYKVHA